MHRIALILSAVGLASAASAASAAESVMVQCGREYQVARTAGTLNGLDWNGYRTECAARLKTAASQPAPAATPASAPLASPPATAAAQPTAAPVLTPQAAATQAAAPQAATAAAAPAPSGGMAAMHVRQKQCGAEWRAQKVALVAQTPGLTWPRYWSQCNTRLKASIR